MAYSQAQLITYELDTYGSAIFFKLVKSEDAKARALRLYEIMKFCYDQIKGNDQDSTLKIFVAPEFYGRTALGAQTGKGHYSTKDVYNAITALREQCIKDGRFDHWFIVPGTFIASEEIKGKTYIFNSIYAIKGDGNVHKFLHKKHFASIDQLDGRLKGGNKLYQQIPDFANISSQFKPVEVGGLTIGMEVCLDHTTKRLRTALGKLKMLPVHIHVVTGCGTVISEKAIAARQKGYFFRCDGMRDKVLSMDWQIEWPGGFYTATATPVTTDNAKRLVDKGAIQLNKPNTTTTFTPPGVISIYEPRLIS